MDLAQITLNMNKLSQQLLVLQEYIEIKFGSDFKEFQSFKETNPNVGMILVPESSLANQLATSHSNSHHHRRPHDSIRDVNDDGDGDVDVDAEWDDRIRVTNDSNSNHHGRPHDSENDRDLNDDGDGDGDAEWDDHIRVTNVVGLEHDVQPPPVWGGGSGDQDEELDIVDDDDDDIVILEDEDEGEEGVEEELPLPLLLPEEVRNVKVENPLKNIPNPLNIKHGNIFKPKLSPKKRPRPRSIKPKPNGTALLPAWTDTDEGPLRHSQFGIVYRNGDRGEKMEYQDYFFRVNKFNRNNGRKYWVCADKACPAKLGQQPDGRPTLTREHNHHSPKNVNFFV